MTLLPRARWQTLLNLDVIQQRNKPKEPPKPIEKAPFFLPTLPGVETRFAPTEKETQKQKKPTKRLDKASGGAESVFHTLLSEADPEGDCKLYLDLL
jgi:U3 small nucleolar RNA-associated protein 21